MIGAGSCDCGNVASDLSWRPDRCRECTVRARKALPPRPAPVLVPRANPSEVKSSCCGKKALPQRIRSIN